MSQLARGSAMIDGGSGELCHDDHHPSKDSVGPDKTDNQRIGH